MKYTKTSKEYSLETSDSIRGIDIVYHSFDCFKSHSHEFYEFEYIIEGEGWCEINGKTFGLKQGDLSFATPMDIHSYKSDKPFKTITVNFYTDNLDKELAKLSDIESCIMKCPDEIKQLFMLLSAERSVDSYRYLFCRNLIEVIAIMFLSYAKIRKNPDMPKEIVYAVGYINQYFRTNIDLKSISEKCNYSTTYMSRQFKKFVGMGFVEYLTDVRAFHAKNLLINSDITVTQIAYECGFGSLRSLNRAFLKKYGCSPNVYKRQNLS